VSATDLRATPARILLTGASGFLGGAIASAALSAGWRVRAVLRRAGALDDRPWREHADLETRIADLAAPGAREALDAALDGVDAVIHAAGAMTGDDEAQARDTVGPTAALIEAMTALPSPPRFALVSSLSVYNFASMPDGACLDETTPLEPSPELRDAYCRAKLAQEALTRRAAQFDGLQARALRPGAIVGPGRLRTARLGFGVGPLLVIPGGRARMPVIGVDDCATLVLRAAMAPPVRSDIPVIAGDGWFEAINLTEPDPPDQTAYAAMIARTGWPGRVARAPLSLAAAPAKAIGLLGMAAPGVARRAPGPLRLETFAARFKPLLYSAARAEDRLGWRPERPFAETLGAWAEPGGHA
jgi:nucleoside-diphosphate-sugar epimerase